MLTNTNCGGHGREDGGTEGCKKTVQLVRNQPKIMTALLARHDSTVKSRLYISTQSCASRSPLNKMNNKTSTGLCPCWCRRHLKIAIFFFGNLYNSRINQSAGVCDLSMECSHWLSFNVLLNVHIHIKLSFLEIINLKGKQCLLLPIYIYYERYVKIRK